LVTPTNHCGCSLHKITKTSIRWQLARTATSTFTTTTKNMFKWYKIFG